MSGSGPLILSVNANAPRTSFEAHCTLYMIVQHFFALKTTQSMEWPPRGSGGGGGGGGHGTCTCIVLDVHVIVCGNGGIAL